MATYWIKVKPGRLGLHLYDLTDELRRKVGSNKGVYIFAVVKDSPAFNSDLLSGDVIRRVNGVEVIDQNYFGNWLNETHPSVIEFEIFRNGENISKKVQLQF
jgi:S1-C subfamily serine protease